MNDGGDCGRHAHVLWLLWFWWPVRPGGDGGGLTVGFIVGVLSVCEKIKNPKSRSALIIPLSSEAIATIAQPAQSGPRGTQSLSLSSEAALEYLEFGVWRP